MALSGIFIGGNLADFPPRHAISRAHFFLKKANQCNVHQRNDFEAYLEAAIVFARAALHRLQSEYKKHPNWNSWWNNLLPNISVTFFRKERNLILKEGPPKIGQVIRLWQASEDAADLYYYDDPAIQATFTVEQHLNSIEKLVLEAQGLFGS